MFLNVSKSVGNGVEGVKTIEIGGGLQAQELIDKLMAISDDVERHMYETFQYIVKAKKD